jgi:prolyl oligopeptidase PreP (S9A serine peptidase family)
MALRHCFSTVCVVRRKKNYSEHNIKVIGYGGNDVSLLPSFSPTWISFVTLHGGIVAFPNIRGGSEFGKGWADAGKKRHLMNGVSDFVSATYVQFSTTKSMNF